MRISLSVTNYSWPPDQGTLVDALVRVARHADDAGVDTLWVADHLLQAEPGRRLDEPMLEAYTTLGFLACATRRVRLGAMVTWASIRAPALAVKAVTTLDVLSGGRAWFGVGAGYQGDEAAMTGLPFPPTAERFDRMEELLRLAAHLWDGDESPFVGPYHRLDHPIGSPRPVRRPRVLIGGSGEKRTLPLVARYADACNLFDIPDGGATLRRKLAVLRDACAAIGRDPDSVEVTVSSRLLPGEPASAFAGRCAALADLGVDHVVLIGNGPWGNAELDVVAEAVAIVAQEAPA